MGTLYDIDNTGNQVAGTIGTRTISNIQNFVLPYSQQGGNFTANVNTEYGIVFNNVTATLPSSPSQGQRVRFICEDTGYFKIQCPGVSYIDLAGTQTSLGGWIQSNDSNTCIELVCTANSGQPQWTVFSFSGNWFNDQNQFTNPINSNTQTLDITGTTSSTGLRISESANGKQGTATLSAGAVTISNTSVTANSRIYLTAQDNNTLGSLRVSARTAGTSFTITSSVGTDSGLVAFLMIEPG